MTIPLGKPRGFYIEHIIGQTETRYLEADATRDSLPDKDVLRRGLVRVTEVYDLCDPAIIKYGSEYQPGKIITCCTGEPLGIHALRDIVRAIETIPTASYKLGGMQEFFAWLEEAHGRKPAQPPEWKVLRSQFNGYCLDTLMGRTFAQTTKSAAIGPSKRRHGGVHGSRSWHS